MCLLVLSDPPWDVGKIGYKVFEYHEDQYLSPCMQNHPLSIPFHPTDWTSDPHQPGVLLSDWRRGEITYPHGFHLFLQMEYAIAFRDSVKSSPEYYNGCLIFQPVGLP
jgi:hypothetical protein